jgi:YVTN family beta-propeller protein
LLVCLGPIVVAQPARAQSYHVARSVTLGGDGGWDLLALDTVRHRLFIPRQNRVMVVDPETGTVTSEITGFDRAHGIAFAQDEGHGFATSGGDSSVVMFDLATLAVLRRTTAAPDADAILYDPATRRIFSFNGKSGSATVIDPVSGQVIGTVSLAGAPEFAVTAGSM